MIEFGEILGETEVILPCEHAIFVLQRPDVQNQVACLPIMDAI